MEQSALQLAPEMTAVDVTLVRRQPTFTGALMLCQTLSGLEDKELCGKRGIVSEAATWSRIKTGSNHFPQDRLMDFMDACGNEAPLIWLADRRGYELVRLETEVERLLRIERERSEKLREENRILRGLVRGEGKA